MWPRHWWYTVPLRLRSLFRGREVERDLDDEVRFHLEKQIEQSLARGLTPDDARGAALRAFGGVEQRKEECRDLRHVWLVDELVRDVTYALRAFAKAPAFTAVVLLTLALGIGANTAVFSVVYGVLFAPLPYPDPGRLAVIYGPQPAPSNCPRCPASYTEYVEWRDQNRVFDVIGASVPEDAVMTGRGAPELVPVARATASLFRVLGVQPQLGRWLTEEEDRPEGTKVVMLTDASWAQRFGRDPRVIGQTIVLDKVSRTIVGVMPRGFTHRGAGFFVPLAEVLDESRRSPHFLSVYGRLKAGITPDRAKAEMIALGHRLAREHNDNDGIDVQSYHSVVVRGAPSLLLVLQGAVAFVLLIACANVANLQLARMAARRREIAVKTAIGATRGRLARQFVTEGLMLAFTGAALGLGVAYTGVRAFVALAPPVVPRMTTIGIDLPVLLFTLGVAPGTGVLFGLAPMLHVRAAGPGDALKEDGGRSAGGRASRRAGQVLVTAEIALSVVLLIGAGLMVKSLLLLGQQDLGFVVDRVLTFTTPLPRDRTEPQILTFYAQALEHLRAVAGVQAVGATHSVPFAGWNTNGFFEAEGKTLWQPGDAPLAEQRFVDGDYHRVMGISLVRGRFFTDRDDERAKKVAIVNQRLARLCWPNEDPLGKRIRFGVGEGEWRARWPRRSRLPRRTGRSRCRRCRSSFERPWPIPPG
jgi:predicted permease